MLNRREQFLERLSRRQFTKTINNGKDASRYPDRKYSQFSHGNGSRTVKRFAPLGEIVCHEEDDLENEIDTADHAATDNSLATFHSLFPGSMEHSHRESEQIDRENTIAGRRSVSPVAHSSSFVDYKDSIDSNLAISVQHPSIPRSSLKDEFPAGYMFNDVSLGEEDAGVDDSSLQTIEYLYRIQSGRTVTPSS
uniref:Uncharacterized protein n=1 Tax=Caenorhabditis japonica TaxID=281687 RepID=A0A8R1EJR3_CAEJA